MRKGMYILPSLFTAANIGAGYYALSQTVLGTRQDFWHFDHAAMAIGVAVVADGLDGRIARMTNTTSDFGREFDSLADVIARALAPEPAQRWPSARAFARAAADSMTALAESPAALMWGEHRLTA